MSRTLLAKISGLILVAAVAIFFVRDLVKPGLPLTHDSNPHIARMIAFHTALQDGQFPPMWAKEVLGGIGSPVLMLNYQLPYFMTEGFVRVGFNYFDSYKIVLALSLILSAITMYLALAYKFGSLAGSLGALVYTLAPYRFVDIYVRGALGESLTYIFPPLLIYGFAVSSLPILILGWTGLFLTHPLASACFSAFFLGYIIFVGEKELIAERIKTFAISFGIALMIAAFNLLPTLALTKYTYYSPTLSNTIEMFPTLTQLFHSPWGYGISVPGPNDGMSFELGAVQWIALLAGLAIAFRSKKRELRYLLIMSGICLFFLLPISAPVYQFLHLGEIIDFPWRLLFCLVFVSAWIWAEMFKKLPVTKSSKYWLAVLMVMVISIQAIPLAHTKEYSDKPMAWYERETGDSYGEYAPLARQTKESAPFWLRAETVEGQAKVTMRLDQSNRQVYTISAETASTIRINTSYFPGWQIWVDDQKEPLGEMCYITTRTQNNIDDSGLMACRVRAGEHKIEIRYVATAVQRIGNMLTLVGTGIFLWILSASFYRHITRVKQSSKT